MIQEKFYVKKNFKLLTNNLKIFFTLEKNSFRKIKKKQTRKDSFPSLKKYIILTSSELKKKNVATSLENDNEL